MGGNETLFLVWGPPSHGPRSKVFARELGIDVEFVEVTKRRGLLAAPYKYPMQFVRTVRLLRRRRPRQVLVQSPPHLAVATVAGYCALTGARYIIDAHSAAMLSPLWTRPRWLNRMLYRRASLTLVTDEHFARQLESYGARALVLRDIPTEFSVGPSPDLSDGFNVMVVNTFSSDEPLHEVMEAARGLPDVSFHVTGRVETAPASITSTAPTNVRFTGYLHDEEYYALMNRSDAVMCLTTRDHTMQRGACEALSMGRPIITSHWDLLRTYFDRGTIHVDNRPTSIRSGVEQMRSQHSQYVSEIRGLRQSQLQQWAEARHKLNEVMEERRDLRSSDAF